MFKLTQTILDRKSSTYESVLTIDTQYGELLGVFTCTIYNSFGVSETESIILEGMEFNCLSLVGLLATLVTSTLLGFTCVVASHVNVACVIDKEVCDDIPM